MANPFFSPIQPHFFQPLLPGFHRHLTVPVKFFLRYIKGREERKAVKLTSEKRERSWEVNMDGRRFIDGWEEFAVEHGFKVGDILLFRHEGGLVFHVTAFGPSCCQIQYARSHPHDDDDDAEDDDINVADTRNRNLSRKKKMKKNPKSGAESDPSDHTCFTTVIRADGLRTDRLFPPRSFLRRNFQDKRQGEILLIDRQGRSWTLRLGHTTSARVYFHQGWRNFCIANGQKVGDFLRFKLVQSGATPVLQLFPAASGNNRSGPGCSRIKEKKRRSNWRVSSSPRLNRFVTLTVSSYSLRTGKLRLPRPFARVNGLDARGQKITLLDKGGRDWPTHLLLEKPTDQVAIAKGWTGFCWANGLNEGDSFTLKLIWRDIVPTLKFCSKV